MKFYTFVSLKNAGDSKHKLLLKIFLFIIVSCLQINFKEVEISLHSNLMAIVLFFLLLSENCFERL